MNIFEKHTKKIRDFKSLENKVAYYAYPHH